MKHDARPSASLQISSELLDWIEALPRTVPWKAISYPPETQSLEKRIASMNMSADSVIAALLWLRIGEIDRSHRIVQHESSAVGSYLHGMVHRLEGDYWNAKYWFRQVREPQLISAITDSVVAILEERRLLGFAQEKMLVQAGKFGAGDFVDACEVASKQRAFDMNSNDLFECVGYAEWIAIWKHVCHSGSRSD
jgi:hypothetical protein